jgi:hypothetical protein
VVSGEDIERRTGHVSLRSIERSKPETIDTQKEDLLSMWRPIVEYHWFYILAVGKSGTIFIMFKWYYSLKQKK